MRYNTTPKTERILDILKQQKEINITNLLKLSKMDVPHLNKVLKELEEQGKIIIAKVETFKGNKKIVQAKYIKLK